MGLKFWTEEMFELWGLLSEHQENNAIGVPNARGRHKAGSAKGAEDDDERRKKETSST